MTERNPVFDEMKGLAILLMIVGHCDVPAPLHHAIYLFHMPLFFIVSGFFYRPKSAGELIVSDCRRLLLPYLICAAAVMLKYAVDGFRLNDFSTLPKFAESLLTGNFGVGPIWFLLALFWCRALFNIARTCRGAVRRCWLQLSSGLWGWTLKIRSDFSSGFRR